MFESSLLAQWVTAIGTVSAVIVALFQKLICDIINRPKIKISFTKTKQCLVETSTGLESGDTSKDLKIRVKLENVGRYIATHAALYVDCYYQKRVSEGSFVKNEITPKQIKDYRNAKPSSIAPHLLYYFDVASITRYESMTTQDEEGKVKQFYKLSLLGEGSPTVLGKGTFIVPLKFYSSRVKVTIAYLKITWESDAYSLDKQFFSAEIISNKDFNKLNKD